MKNTTPIPSYDGEPIYVGIDVHKRTYTVVARVGQTIMKKWTTIANPVELAGQLRKYFPGGIIHSVYEAGFSGLVLHRELVEQGIDNMVVHAAAVEVAAHNRVKTDKRDADKLSAQLAAGRLRGIAVVSVAQEQRRMLSRTREQLVAHRAALKNQIRMKAHQWGLIAPEDRREMSHAMVSELLERAPSVEFTLTVTALHQVWQSIDQQIEQLEVQLKQQAQQEALDATYRSVPGVGAISARVLANELGDLSSFANERQLFGYTGFTSIP
jgi:transposase